MTKPDGTVVTYTYDGFNEMKSCGGVTYTYRANGLRYSKTSGGSTTVHIWDGQNIALDITGTNVVKYIRGINLIARDDGTNISYYLYNAHGDVVALTNSTGAVTKTYTYDAFGNEVNPSQTDANPYRYCGESNPNKLGYDKETGTIYLRARYYDPGIGRFTSEDIVRKNTFKLPNEVEVADSLSLNLYTYCANNPIAHIDPSGHIVETIFDIIGLGWSIYDMIKTPSWMNFGFLLWDIASIIVPIAPGSYVGKGVKAGATAISKADDVADAVKAGEKAALIFKNSAKGKAFERAGLDLLGAVKNTTKIDGHIADVLLTDGKEISAIIEFKNVRKLSNSKQLTTFIRQAGKNFNLVIAADTTMSKPLMEAIIKAKGHVYRMVDGNLQLVDLGKLLE